MPTNIPLTHGQALRRLATADFRLIETRHQRGMHVRGHEHARACINFVLEGGYAETTANGPGLYGPLWSLFKPAGERHENDFRESGSRCLLVEARTNELPGSELFRPRETRDPRVAVVALRLWYELTRPDELTELTVDELSNELYARALGASDPPAPASKRLDRVVELLHDDPREAWTLSRLAGEVGLHPSHLARVFRRRHGRTIGEYLRELRVGHVARALALGRRSIAELAALAGFADQSHCTRSFRRLLGTTPAAYRRALSC